ncbi:M14 family metallopeptidase [Paraflavitalea sp. CAU 1676]|uniref:M14 family metallopeptidase n=1 Tax=Paraflavitalea sp. CAU 1676 TaxID=3032598 RepID=UPI0023DBB3D9|nr:M14 family metallopeptidase [Paraflavitalea sp. CAU 1676]MDF2187741.1 M14 family metallopeptidase [Paraflavitalea sp. CAU 1676]
MKRNISRVILSCSLAIAGLSLQAQQPNQVFKGAGSPVRPKVSMSWNRYNDHAGITDICKKIAAAYPDLCKLESIGKSFQGRDLWCLTISDYKKGGDVTRKPAMYIDGNIHSNEVQGSEFALYTAWYLTESFGDTKYIQDLLADKTFYIVPTINPDARDNFFHEANNANSPRSGLIPVDNDRDGAVDEDGYDDLDKDGNIVMMRRKNPNGRWKQDTKDPRKMVQVGPEEKGDYEILGVEGIDNDGDGLVNEDGYTFEYDPNRDWGWGWQPNYIQGGAYKYPFSLPENRAVMEFVMKHPNIAAAQSYHNSGGMILRGPGGQEDVGTYNANDVRIYDVLGKKGEELLPGYRYLVVYKDLYSAYGGELDWFYGGRGVYTFSNELWTPYLMFNKGGDDDDDSQEDPSYKFDRNLLFRDGFVQWHEYDHPQYGKIEIGGFKKNFGRMHPGFLMESDAHRNMSFSIFHCYQTPKLSIDSITEKDLGDGLKEITAVIANERIIPTHASQDLKFKIERPDYISLTGAKVIAGMVVENRDLGITIEQKTNPATIEVANIPGQSTVTVRWIVQANGKYTISVDSRKGGLVSKTK